MTESKKVSSRTTKKTTKKKVAKTTTKKAASKKTTAKKTSKKVAKKTTTKKAVTKKTTKKVAKTAATKKTVSKKTTKKADAKKVTKKASKKKTTTKKAAPVEEPIEVVEIIEEEAPVEQPADAVDEVGEEPALDENGEPIKKKRRRRRGGRGRRKQKQIDEGAGEEAAADADPAPDEVEEGPSVEERVENWDEVFEDRTFEDLGLRNTVLKGTRAAGFRHPTKIQAELIPLVLDGHDVLGQSRTGTGKTASFALPLIHSVRRAEPFQAFILAPTRELAIQIADEVRTLSRFTPVRTAAIYGGQKIHSQQKKLENGPEIVVATPGRLMDMKERGHLHFHNTRFAVLDEVDRMLDIGFRDDIRQILKSMPAPRQTVFVSATISPEIENLSRTFMDDPQRLTTTGSSLTVSLVEQFYISVEPWDKRRLLHHILTHEDPALTIVFCRTKRTVDKVAQYLTDQGIDAQGIHGDMYQGKRNTVIRRLRDGKLTVLVASDLAARGLDVDGITHVVNYDLPDDPEIYIHRIGRTARAGRDGVAWAFVTPEQGGLLTDIEKLANTHVEPKMYPAFKPGPVPADIRDERARDRHRVESKQSQSRFDVPLPPSRKVDESKFPGGIVPTKRPPKALRGRVRTTRSMKDAPKDDAEKS